MAQSEVLIRSVLARFAQSQRNLGELAQGTNAQNAAIKDEVCESLVQLQFADRVSQILASVVKSMQDVQAQVPLPGSQGQWAQQPAENLRRTYTTEEQPRNPDGQPTSLAER